MMDKSRSRYQILGFILFSFMSFLSSESNYAITWQVGPTHTYTMPSQVSTLVSNSDTIDIDAGVYPSDVALWTADNLVLKGVGGMAHMQSNGNSYGGKAIWVIAGNNTWIENIEFSECVVGDNNGAGIRQEGRNLIVKHCYFHNNQEGILAGTVNPSNITIEYTEFGNNGYSDGQAHNLYINHIDTLVFRFNYSHHAIVGHELKSRAHVNYILYNRFSEEASGTASRSIDLPNGGTSFIIGNVIEQGSLSENFQLIGYGLEGLTNPSPHALYAVNNTLVNNQLSGIFFDIISGTQLFKCYNNIFAGPGFIMVSSADTMDFATNWMNTDISAFNFNDPLAYDYSITEFSLPAIDSGSVPGYAGGFNLAPVYEYVHPAGGISRCNNGPLDIGAYEMCSNVGMEELAPIDFIVYPNPVRDVLHFKGKTKKSIEVKVYNALGMLVLQTSGPKDLDFSDLLRGVYFVSIKERSSLSVIRIIKL